MSSRNILLASTVIAVVGLGLVQFRSLPYVQPLLDTGNAQSTSGMCSTGNFASQLHPYNQNWIASITCRRSDGTTGTIDGSWESAPRDVTRAVRNAILSRNLPYRLPDDNPLRRDSVTLNAVCKILGYDSVVSSTCKDGEPGRHKCNWDSPGDNALTYFHGTLCGGPSGNQCSNDIDDDGDGLIDWDGGNCTPACAPQTVSEKSGTRTITANCRGTLSIDLGNDDTYVYVKRAEDGVKQMLAYCDDDYPYGIVANLCGANPLGQLQSRLCTRDGTDQGTVLSPGVPPREDQCGDTTMYNFTVEAGDEIILWIVPEFGDDDNWNNSRPTTVTYTPTTGGGGSTCRPDPDCTGPDDLTEGSASQCSNGMNDDSAYDNDTDIADVGCYDSGYYNSNDNSEYPHGNRCFNNSHCSNGQVCSTPVGCTASCGTNTSCWQQCLGTCGTAPQCGNGNDDNDPDTAADFRDPGCYDSGTYDSNDNTEDPNNNRCFENSQCGSGQVCSTPVGCTTSCGTNLACWQGCLGTCGVGSTTISVTKVLINAPAVSGKLLNYRISVTNTGNVPAANVVVRDDGDQRMLFEGATGDGTCQKKTASAGYWYIECLSHSPIAPNATISFTTNLRVPTGLCPVSGTPLNLSNFAQVSGSNTNNQTAMSTEACTGLTAAACSNGTNDDASYDSDIDFRDPGCYTNGIYVENDTTEYPHGNYCFTSAQCSGGQVCSTPSSCTASCGTNIACWQGCLGTCGTIPQCSNGVDDNDADPDADVADPGCYTDGVYSSADTSEDPNGNYCFENRHCTGGQSCHGRTKTDCSTTCGSNVTCWQQCLGTCGTTPQCSNGTNDDASYDSDIDFRDPGCYTNGIYVENDTTEYPHGNYCFTSAQCSGGQVCSTPSSCTASCGTNIACWQGCLGTCGGTSAALSMTKADDGQPVVPGQNYLYRINVKNSGNSPASNVSILDTLPADLEVISTTPTATFINGQTVTWSNQSIPVTSVGQEYIVLVRVRTTVTVSKTITNTAVLTYGSTTVNASDTTDIVVGSTTGCITIQKTALSPTGGILTPVPEFSFKIDGGSTTYSNNTSGTVTIPSVNVGSHTITEVSQSGWNQLSVNPAGGVVNVIAGSTCSVVSFINQQVTTGVVDMAINKTVSTSTVTPGSTLTYTLTVQNLGSRSANTVTVTDTLDTDLQYVSVTQTPNDATCTVTGSSPQTVQCVYGSFAANTTKTITITALVKSDVSCTNNAVYNTATVSTVDSESNGGNNVSSVTTGYSNCGGSTGNGCIDVTTTSVDRYGNTLSNQYFTYRLDNTQTATNTSYNYARFNNVSTGYHTVTQDYRSNWTTTMSPSNGYVYVSSGNSCAAITVLNIQNDEYSNNYDYDIYITDNETEVEPLDDLTYRIQVRNNSNTYRSNVQLRVNLSSKLDFSSVSNNGYLSNRTVIWNNVNLSAYETRDFYVYASVLNDATGTISTDAEIDNRRATDTTRIGDGETTSGKELTFSKRAIQSEAVPGGAVDYEVIVENTGTVTVSNIEVIDYLPPGTTVINGDGGTGSSGRITWKKFSLSRGSEKTFRYRVGIGNLAPGSLIINRATLRADGVSDECSTAVPVMGMLPQTGGFDSIPPTVNLTPIVTGSGEDSALAPEALAAMKGFGLGGGYQLLQEYLGY